jgi:hypothetical protein
MRGRITPSLVLSLVAVVLASTGSAVAAGLITGKQVKDSSLTGKDIKNKSLTPSDFSGSVQGPQGRQGVPGVPGTAGPQGIQGPAGPTAVAKLTRVRVDGSVAAGDVNGVDADCPSGQSAVSGGYVTAGTGVVFSQDSFGGSGWSVLYDNYYGSQSAPVSAVAYCAPSNAAVQPRSAIRGSEIADAIAAQKASHG